MLTSCIAKKEQYEGEKQHISVSFIMNVQKDEIKSSDVV